MIDSMITTLFREPFPTSIQIIYLSRYSPLAGLPHQNPSTCLRYSDFDVGALSSNTPYSGGGLPTYIGLRVNLYRARREAILVVASTYIGRSSDLYRFHTPLPDMPLRSDTQALRLIASIPLVQRSEKHRSREEKSVFP